MKKIIVILVGLGLILGAIFLISKKKYKDEKQMVEVKVERGDIVSIFRINGNVEPRNRLPIKPQIAGRIEDILVVEGQKVKKGQIIAYLSSSERSALLDIAKSQGEQEYKKWQEVYKPTPIIAPLDGFIIVRDKEPGQTVNTADYIVVMADELIIKAYVDETDLRYVKINQPVKISLDAYPDIKFGGIVEHISYESTLINNVTVYEIKIKPIFSKAELKKYKISFIEKRKTLQKEETRKKEVSEPQEKNKERFWLLEQKDISSILRSGMSATIEVIAEEKKDVLVLPVNAVIDNGKEKYVLSKEEGKIVKKIVETGISNGKNVEIISGLNEGDIVLVPQEKGSKRTAPSQQRGAPNPMGSFFRR